MKRLAQLYRNLVEQASSLRVHEASCFVYTGATPGSKDAPSTRRLGSLRYDASFGPCPRGADSKSAIQQIEKSALHPRSQYVKPADRISICTNCYGPSISSMNDMVPNFPSLGNDPFDRVAIWPRSDMFHCVPILSAKDAPRLTLLPRHSKAPACHALRHVPVLSRKQVFYRVPIVHRAISESIA